MSTRSKKSEVLLRVEDVSFSYSSTEKPSKKSAVRNTTLNVHQGEFLCLLGPSGCGKTTLLRLIAGLETPRSGEITVSGINDRNIEIGMVFQDLALFPHMSVARNVGYALRDLSRLKRKNRTDEILALVGLLEKRGAYPYQLSGGQKQRLALARALARRPDLILLDEPFAAQDSNRRSQIRDDVMHILRDAGVAAILVTHDPEEAMHFADRIAIMKDGHIEQIAPPVEIYNTPKNAFVASFFGQVNVLEGVVERGAVATSLGTIPVSDIADNTPVSVIVRPEAFSLCDHDPAIDHADPDHVHGTVSEQKYLGRSTLVHLDTHDLDAKDAGPLHIHARIPGVFSSTAGEIQDISLNPAQVFVFEKETE